MEALIELVAASLVRHGIECPAAVSQAAPGIRSAEPAPLAVLPEHSFGKKPDGDVVT